MIKVDKKEFRKLYNIACDAWKKKFDEKLSNFFFSDYVEFEEKFVDDMKNACDSKQLKILNILFKDYSEEKNVEMLKNYKDICKKLNVTVLNEDNFSFLPFDQRKKALAYHKIKNIESYFSKGWKPNWDDSSEYKYYPYFEKQKGGWVFTVSYGYFSYFSGLVGFYQTREISDHVGTYFKDIYIALID